jgi:protein ImuB
MLWACILLPQLALDGVIRRHPTSGEPLALISGAVQKRVLHAVNPAAEAAGLRIGQPLTTALTLCHRFAKVDYDDAEVERTHDFLAAWAYRYGSLVSRTMPSTLLLEVESSFKLFGPWPRFEARLRHDLRELGFAHRMVLAPNPWAARALINQHDGLAITQAAPLQNALGQLRVTSSGLPMRCAKA